MPLGCTFLYSKIARYPHPAPHTPKLHLKSIFLSFRGGSEKVLHEEKFVCTVNTFFQFFVVVFLPCRPVATESRISFVRVRSSIFSLGRSFPTPTFPLPYTSPTQRTNNFHHHHFHFSHMVKMKLLLLFKSIKS